MPLKKDQLPPGTLDKNQVVELCETGQEVSGIGQKIRCEF